jgi:enamine deaminase RidA (YjgF/YER057c/UK114 family)
LRWLHTAGQVALRADGSVPATFAEQCEQALANLTAVLDAAQMSPPDIVKLTCYVVGTQDLDVLYAARRAQLRGSAPAATVIVVQALAAPDFLVEIEAVAATDGSHGPPT